VAAPRTRGLGLSPLEPRLGRPAATVTHAAAELGEAGPQQLEVDEALAGDHDVGAHRVRIGRLAVGRRGAEVEFDHPALREALEILLRLLGAALAPLRRVDAEEPDPLPARQLQRLAVDHALDAGALVDARLERRLLGTGTRRKGVAPAAGDRKEKGRDKRAPRTGHQHRLASLR
jgi:hypothetical protein